MIHAWVHTTAKSASRSASATQPHSLAPPPSVHQHPQPTLPPAPTLRLLHPHYPLRRPSHPYRPPHSPFSQYPPPGHPRPPRIMPSTPTTIGGQTRHGHQHITTSSQRRNLSRQGWCRRVQEGISGLCRRLHTRLLGRRSLGGGGGRGIGIRL